jgi:hypothetical protein
MSRAQAVSTRRRAEARCSGGGHCPRHSPPQHRPLQWAVAVLQWAVRQRAVAVLQWVATTSR